MRAFINSNRVILGIGLIALVGFLSWNYIKDALFQDSPDEPDQATQPTSEVESEPPEPTEPVDQTPGNEREVTEQAQESSVPEAQTEEQLLRDRVVGFTAAWWTQSEDDIPQESRQQRIAVYSTDSFDDRLAQIEQELAEDGLFNPYDRAPQPNPAGEAWEIEVEVDGHDAVVTTHTSVVYDPEGEPLVVRKQLKTLWVQIDDVWYVDELIDYDPPGMNQAS